MIFIWKKQNYVIPLIKSSRRHQFESQWRRLWIIGLFFVVFLNNYRNTAGLENLDSCLLHLASNIVIKRCILVFMSDASSLNNIVYEYTFDRNPGQCENHCRTQISRKRQTRMGSFILEGFHRTEIENVVCGPLLEKSLRKFRLKGNADGNWLWIFWLGPLTRLIKNNDERTIVFSDFIFSHIWR
jgi:hypothetical protein